VFMGDTMSMLMHNTIRQHMDCRRPDAVLNIETHLFNVELVAHSCDYNLDVGHNLWLNRGRWSRLIKEYVPREALNRFVSQAKEILSGDARLGATANMLFRDPDRYAKKHRWGGCLMGATFRGDNGKAGGATLTFFSRTTYIGYMGLLDAAIAHVMAREIARPEDISFRWVISSMQLHCFKTLPYIYSQPDLMEQLERLQRRRKLIDHAPPTWRHLAKWYCKVVDGWTSFTELCDDPGNEEAEAWLGTEKYGPFRRIKRRWCEFRGYLNKHIPPSLPVGNLDFDKAV